MSSALAIAAMALFLAVSPAHAHTRSRSYSTWTITEEGARAEFRISRLEASRLPFAADSDLEVEREFPGYLVGRLQLLEDQRPCEAESPRRLGTSREWIAYSWKMRCRGTGRRTLVTALMFDVSPSHLHFARVAIGNNPPVERVLHEAEPAWPIPRENTHLRGARLSSYFVLGAEHIATGWDHLAFVVALLLLAATLRELAALVTAFTVAHSITLALALGGWLRPDPAPVEALIGFSIALVCAENVWLFGRSDRWIPGTTIAGLVGCTFLAGFGIGAVPALTLFGLAVFSACHFALLARSPSPAPLRAAVAFAFGLVHGFGFAGILAELELAPDRLAPALFAFNVGVEAGQLAIIAVLWPAMRALARAGSDRTQSEIVAWGSAAIGAVGVFWFVSRTFG